MANEIIVLENEVWSLRLLLTQKHLYGRAKIALAFQITVVVLVPGILMLLHQWKPALRVWTALYGLVAAIIDVALLDAVKTGYRKRAAAVQEQFDCQVLGLAWPELKAGSKTDPEDILLAEESDARLRILRDWYARDVAELPEYVARIICQRSNCWWDSRLRRWYRGVILGAAFLLVLGITIVAVMQDRTVNDFILGFLAPTLPMVLWVIREARGQAEAADRADRLKKFGDELWAGTLRRAVDEQAAVVMSREFQDEILAHRRQSPLIFDWFYKLLRKRFKEQMSSSVDAMVKEAKAAGL